MRTPFGTSLRRNADDPRRLWERIDAQIAERIEDALDSACLDLMVELRRAHDLPMPVATSARDRGEFDGLVGALLDRLGALTADLTAEQRTRLPQAPAATSSVRARALALQVDLAKLLPDYWTRFDQLRIDFANERRTAATSQQSKR
jgi:hypothetical protein